MIFEYFGEVVNDGNKIDDFYQKNKFVGFILPNGELYRTKNHNVDGISSFFYMSLHLLINYYDEKNSFLLDTTDDKLGKIVLNYLKKASKEELIALSKFINENHLDFSDLLVQLFGCHLITRLNKEILTSSYDKRCFYNYLLNNFKVYVVDKIVYNQEKEEFCFSNTRDFDIELDSEIKDIQNEVSQEEIDIFMKK